MSACRRSGEIRARGRRQSEFVAQAGDLTHSVDKNALSILSRYPIVNSANAWLPECPGDEPRQVLLAQCAIEGRPLAVANTHLVYLAGVSKERKAQTAAALAAIDLFCADTVKAQILCGDFNDVPDSPAVRLVLDNGFQDTYAQCHPGKPGITFSRINPYVPPAYPEDRRLDYIFATGDIEPDDCSIVFAGRDGLGYASDHYGVFCKLAIR